MGQALVEYEVLRREVQGWVKEQTDALAKFESETLQRIEMAKNDAVLTSLSNITRRLDAIEKRLPEEELEEEE